MDEPFSNPIAPANEHHSKNDFAVPLPVSQSHYPLTNDDFRKLMMTPRASSGSASLGSSGSASIRSSRKTVLKTAEAIDNKNKKKKFYAAIKKDEESVLADLSKRYRDRAKERRDNANPDYQNDDDPLSSVPAYHAVGPDMKTGAANAAEKRKKLIEESKFLGGDMKHTHLVKGLDYALLQKVKAEIMETSALTNEELNDDNRDYDDDDNEGNEVVKKNKDKRKEDNKEIINKEKKKTDEDNDDCLYNDKDNTIKSIMAANIMKCIVKSKLPERNDLFLPGRMAYVVDLEDESAEDIPTTVIRSKVDCPNIESITSLSTNDIVINKLTQILSYLRQGGGKRKKKDKSSTLIPQTDIKDNKDSEKQKRKIDFDDSIYGNIGDYLPEKKPKEIKESVKHEKEREKDRHRHHHSHSHNHHRDHHHSSQHETSSHNRHSYFKKSSKSEDEEEIAEEERKRKEKMKMKRNDINEINSSSSSNNHLNQHHNHNSINKNNDNDSINVRVKRSIHNEPDSYAECYPGAPENDDAILDSDEDVDYSKMDIGNKKGTVGRWDFDTAEEYGEYMSNREAMPKAAFQYGVKMADGRKTRRIEKKKDEKAKFNREFQKINAIMKRKVDSQDPNKSLTFQ